MTYRIQILLLGLLLFTSVSPSYSEDAETIRGFPLSDLCALDKKIQERAIDEFLDQLGTAPDHWEPLELTESETDKLIGAVDALYKKYLTHGARRDGLEAVRVSTEQSCRSVARDILSRVPQRRAIAYIFQNIFVLQPSSEASSMNNFVMKHLGPKGFCTTIRDIPIGSNHLIAALICSEAVTPELLLDLIAKGDVKVEGFRKIYTPDVFECTAAYIVYEKMKRRTPGEGVVNHTADLPIAQDQPGTKQAVQIRDLATLMENPDSKLIGDIREAR